MPGFLSPRESPILTGSPSPRESPSPSESQKSNRSPQPERIDFMPLLTDAFTLQYILTNKMSTTDPDMISKIVDRTLKYKEKMQYFEGQTDHDCTAGNKAPGPTIIDNMSSTQIIENSLSKANIASSTIVYNLMNPDEAPKIIEDLANQSIPATVIQTNSQENLDINGMKNNIEIKIKNYDDSRKEYDKKESEKGNTIVQKKKIEYDIQKIKDNLQKIVGNNQSSFENQKVKKSSAAPASVSAVPAPPLPVAAELKTRDNLIEEQHQKELDLKKCEDSIAIFDRKLKLINEKMKKLESEIKELLKQIPEETKEYQDLQNKLTQYF